MRLAEGAGAGGPDAGGDASRCVVLWRCSGGTLAHWGHAQIDGLWPFVVAYLRGRLDGCAETFVLDIGRYMLPLVAAAAPHLRVSSFHDEEALPAEPREVRIDGHGMPRPYERSAFSPKELRAVRLFHWLQCEAEVSEAARSGDARTVLLIGRRTTRRLNWTVHRLRSA